MISANLLKFYINGAWVDPVSTNRMGVGDPVACKLRAGNVNLNYPAWDTFAPFGGYKQSGNGREYADWGIHDFCEVKGIVGYGA